MAKRVFLVGCARSGTTLFQSMLAAHPLVCSFPETQFFPVLIGGLQERMQPGLKNSNGTVRRLLKKIRMRAGIAFPRHEKAMRKMKMLYSAIGKEEYPLDLHASSLSIRSYAELFVKIMDDYASQTGAECWVEKSPNHLYYIKEIEHYVENAKFLHIVRSGEDVVASIYDAAKRHSQGNDFSCDIDNNIQRWNSAIITTEQYCNSPNHFVLKYEDLVADADSKLSEVCRFMEIEYSPEMISSRTDAAMSLIRKDESWKEGVSGEIEKSRLSKFDAVFTKQQQQHIRDRLKKSTVYI